MQCGTAHDKHKSMNMPISCVSWEEPVGSISCVLWEETVDSTAVHCRRSYAHG